MPMSSGRGVLPAVAEAPSSEKRSRVYLYSPAMHVLHHERDSLHYHLQGYI